MRSLLLILATVAVLAAAFGAYVWMQPPTLPQTSVARKLATRPTPAPAPPATSAADQPILHGGEDVWLKMYDQKTNRLASQFRASRYDPLPEGPVNVTRPQAEFFLEDDQIVRIEGTHGRVVLPPEATRDTAQRGPTAAPSRGELYDVKISISRAQEPNHAWLVCRMNNIAFDNDTFRIATESFEQPDGAVISADQVPVEVRGDEYDFDGQGLSIRWNDRDRRLQMLEIAHGKSLTIKSPRLLEGLAGATGSAQSPAPPRRASERKSTQPQDTIAHADPATTNPAQAEPRLLVLSSTQEASYDVYRARFQGPVRIMQNQQQLAIAQMMEVQFCPDADQSQPATAPATKEPATAGMRSSAAVTATPTPQPQPQPVVIHWPGKLVIEPVEAESSTVAARENELPPPGPGEMSIKMSSTDSPVILNHLGSEIHCASFQFDSTGQRLLVSSSEQLPQITLKDSKELTLTTAGISYDAITDQAVFTGRSHLQHPQMNLESDQLIVGFAPGADPNSDELSVAGLKATGNVVCGMTSKSQTVYLTSNELSLATIEGADGEIVPHTVTADGDVKAVLDKQNLSASHMNVTLSPTTRPTDEVQIKELFARDVKFETGDASGACDHFTATADGEGYYDLTLAGQEPWATVTYRAPTGSSGSETKHDTLSHSTLKGPIIKIQPKGQQLAVVGPGSLSGEQLIQADTQPQPFEMSWESGMDVAGSMNRVDVAGNVTINSNTPDGSKNHARGDKLVMELADDPAATTQPATQPTDPMAAAFSTLRQKKIRSVTLEGVKVLKSVSELADADGMPLRSLHLFAPLVRGEPQTQRFTVPSAGSMLYENRESPNKPATQPIMSLGNMAGRTGFQWKKQLNYEWSGMQNRLEMIGDVIIVHEGSDADAQTLRLQASSVCAELEPDEQLVSQSTTPPAAQSAEELFPTISQRKLKLLKAAGGVQVSARQFQLEADEIAFDPQTSILKARGKEGVPVQVYDDSGISTGSFEEAEIFWDEQKPQIKRWKNVQAQIRR